MKTRVAVLFGGNSVEHEVSIITGLQACNALDRSRYEPVPVYITKQNEWYVGGRVEEIAAYRHIPSLLAGAARVVPVAMANRVDLLRFPMRRFGDNTAAAFEVALPAVHGTHCEDGTLMGLLELLGIPYTGCDITASALGMDKYAMKAVLEQAGLPVLPAVAYSLRQYTLEPDRILDGIEERFGYPVIVKPVNLGSSVGISKAGKRAELADGMATAYRYARRVLVERAVPNLREINCAVLGDADEVQLSACERPVGADKILSYRDKYMADGKTPKSGGMHSLKRICPADIPDDMTRTVQKLAADAFLALGCGGVARIDFLNDTETGELWINEINTIPGSLAFYLFEASGLSYPRLLSRMIDLAFKRHRENAAVTTRFDTNILAGFNGTKGVAGTKG